MKLSALIKFCKIALSLVLPFLLISVNLISQTEQYKFRHLTTKDGLSSHFVKCIAKDSRGFMWFGTSGGLDRYDGYNIKTYNNNPNDSTSISSNSVKTLLEETNGDLLIGTTEGGLNRFHFEEDKFTPYKHNQNDITSISDNRINVLYRDLSGLVWVGTQNGLNLFDSDNGTFIAFKQNPDIPNSKNDQINEIYCDNMESLWIGTNDGLFKFHIENNEFEPVDLITPSISTGNRHKIINTIIEDCNHVLWVGTDLLIFRISDGKQEWVGVQSK